MSSNQLTRVAMIGCGSMARGHIRTILRLQNQEPAQIVVVCEPSPEMYAEMSKIFTEAGLPVPPNQPDLAKLLADFLGGPENRNYQVKNQFVKNIKSQRIKYKTCYHNRCKCTNS